MKKKDVVFNCDISVFVGNEEDLTSDQIVGWKEYTRGDFTIHFFKGDHFFINQKMEEVVKKINVILKKSGKFINK